jgi:hypothetical protein
MSDSTVMNITVVIIAVGGNIFVAFVVIKMSTWAIFAKGWIGKAAGVLNAKTGGLTNKAKEFGENRDYYQRRQMARDARNQEKRRAHVEDYAALASSDTWRGRRLRQRAAGGLKGQLFNSNQAGQERQRLAAMGQLEKFEHEETAQAAGLIEANRVTAPGELQSLAAGGIAKGVDGREISARGNHALQRAAIQKIIDAQDAEQLENLFMNRTAQRDVDGNIMRDANGNVAGYVTGNVDQGMLVGELQKGKNYSTTKGAGAHLVSMGVKPGGIAYSQTEIQDRAVKAMSKLASDKLAQQDGPAWQSAYESMRKGAASGASLEERQAMWDLVNAIKSDKRAEAMIKGSAKEAFEGIHSKLSGGGRPTV